MLAQHGHGKIQSCVKIAFAMLHHIPAGLAQSVVVVYSWANVACFHKQTSC